MCGWVMVQMVLVSCSLFVCKCMTTGDCGCRYPIANNADGHHVVVVGAYYEVVNVMLGNHVCHTSIACHGQNQCISSRCRLLKLNELSRAMR